jgi:hypothetical protein
MIKAASSGNNGVLRVFHSHVDLLYRFTKSNILIPIENTSVRKYDTSDETSWDRVVSLSEIALGNTNWIIKN